ncbi:hypothetical protein Ancab_039623 [Ancistrocladus abbreviatus]
MAASSIASATQWIATQMANEANFLLGVKDQVRNLQSELSHIQQLLRDVDSPEKVGDAHLQIFIGEIRKIAFQAEDVIDDYILVVASRNKKDGNFLRGCVCFLAKSPHMHQVGMEIQAIVKGLQQAFERFQRYPVPRAIASEGPSNDNNRPKQAGNYKVLTYPHTDDAHFVGREDDIEKLVELVTGMNYSGQRCGQEARVVAIVGGGGVGKTTLTRKIYRDERVKDHFSRVAWVTISQQWNNRDLLREIITQIGAVDREERNSLKDWTKRELVEKTHTFLSENLHLIVLDDMWMPGAWDDICDALPLNNGSKVIFTTRSDKLHSHVDLNCFVHKPTLLTEEQSLELFKKIAFEDEDDRAITDDFLRLGTEMTQKCDGLPLAVSILAGLLRTKHTLDEWEHVSKTFGSLLLKVEGPPHYGKSLYQTLMLSYHDLPDYLKPCFLYLAQFPEDYEIKSKKLIQMWIADGFVPGDENPSEEVAREYLDELICRCMVLVVKSNCANTKAKSIRLHDVMREFCIAKAKDECFLEVHAPNDRRLGTSSTSDQSRRITILPGGTYVPTKISHIRSFIQFGVEGSRTASLRGSWTEHFKLFRVLILDWVETHDGYLPETLGNLKHLRYLALTNTNIKTLPKSIGNLCNLLYLEYELKWNIEGKTLLTLPNVLWKMKQLRHLYLDERAVFPKKLKLHHVTTNLQTLWIIKGTCSEEEMERMGPSLSKLGIMDIKGQRLLDALFRSPCMKSGNLKQLQLQWRNGAELKSMEPLYNHCPRLRYLLLDGKIGEDCALQFPPGLDTLVFFNNETCNDPMAGAGRVGQLNFLSLSRNAYIGAEITCNVASFPQLETLYFYDLDNLEEWRVEEGALPRLKTLHICECPKLKRLPEELKCIRSLQDLKLINMPRSFCHRLFRQGDKTSYGYSARAADNGGERGEDFYIIQHISHVYFSLVVASDGDDQAEC